MRVSVARVRITGCCNRRQISKWVRNTSLVIKTIAVFVAGTSVITDIFTVRVIAVVLAQIIFVVDAHISVDQRPTFGRAPKWPRAGAELHGTADGGRDGDDGSLLSTRLGVGGVAR